MTHLDRPSAARTTALAPPVIKAPFRLCQVHKFFLLCFFICRNTVFSLRKTRRLSSVMKQTGPTSHFPPLLQQLRTWPSTCPQSRKNAFWISLENAQLIYISDQFIFYFWDYNISITFLLCLSSLQTFPYTSSWSSNSLYLSSLSAHMYTHAFP